MTKDERIQQIIDVLTKKHIRLTVNKIIVSSLFYPGGTLAGYEKEIKRMIKAQPKRKPLSGIQVIEIGNSIRRV